MAIILKNGTFINWETLEFVDAHIVVSENDSEPLKFVKKGGELEVGPSDKVIDCTGQYITKSFGVGHHHVYSALARGMPAPAAIPTNFREILKYIWWNLDKALDAETIEASALATAIACAKSGATFAIDHHASPNHIKGSLQIIARAFDNVGVSHLLCYEVTDRDGHQQTLDGIEENYRHITENQGLVGLHASFTVGSDTLKMAAELMEETGAGIHMHLAEDLYDQEHCLEKFGKRVAFRLKDFGFLDNPKSILVHGLHLDEAERALLANSPVWIAQNMESNLKNKVGYFNGYGLANERVMLGTDGMHSDMLQSAKAAFFAGLKIDKVSPAIIYERFRNVHRYLAANNFVGDGASNLVVLDYDTPTPLTPENYLGHFIFGMRSHHVRHVISNGKLIVRDWVVRSIDEASTLEFTKAQAKRLWEKL